MFFDFWINIKDKFTFMSWKFVYVFSFELFNVISCFFN